MLLAAKLRCPAAAGLEIVLGARRIMICHDEDLLRGFGARHPGCLNRLLARSLARMLRRVIASCRGRCIVIWRTLCAGGTRSLLRLLLPSGAPAVFAALAAHAH